MKTQNKKKIKNLLCILGLSTIVGLSACSSHYEYENNVNHYQYEEKLKHKNITYDDSTYNVFYDTSDNTSDTWAYIVSVLSSAGYNSGTNALHVSGVFTYGDNSTINISGLYVYNNNLYLSGTLFYSSSSNAWKSQGSTLPFVSLSITSQTYYNLVLPAEDDIPQVLDDFVSILVGGISSLATGIASGISAMASALFLKVNASTGTVEGLSLFGGIIAIFAGLALAIAITTRVYLWITRLGN